MLNYFLLNCNNCIKRAYRILNIAIFLLVLLLPYSLLASPLNNSELIRLTNAARKDAGLPPLIINPNLTQAALNKARDMLAQGYFAHTNPQNKQFYEWIDERGYNYLYAGENLAIDFATNEGAMSAWLDSRLHKENIINENYHDIGIVVLRGSWQGRETSIAVQMFGSITTDHTVPLSGNNGSYRIDNSIAEEGEKINNVKNQLIVIPRFAGYEYFDVIGKPNKKITLGISQSTRDQIMATPSIKITAGETYQAPVQAKSNCCQNNTVFSLTDNSKNNSLVAPITYPSFLDIMDQFNIKKIGRMQTPANVSFNTMLAGLSALILLFIYRDRLVSLSKIKRNDNAINQPGEQ